MIQSGEALLESRPELEQSVDDHEERGELLRNVALAYVVVRWSPPGRSGVVGADVRQGARGDPLRLPATALLAVGAVALLVTLFLAGDSGARAVWG